MSLLGVDVGGTFTDFYFLRDGALEVHKRPSTPENPALSVIDGILEKGWKPGEAVHGSTIATNTVLQRRGARTAFIASKGFRDLLTIGRQARSDLYDLEPSRPQPLVPRELCFEADERLDHRGEALRQLTRAEVRRIAEAVTASDADSVAICLLFSFLRPGHERLLADVLRARGLDVSASHEVLPEFREYERASTTALNAYVAPVVRGYLEQLQERLADIGSPVLRVIQSSGGVATARQAARLPASLLLSGPAGGVAGAFWTAWTAGFDQVITFDMGGTSTDVSLCPGEVPFTTEWSVSGLPVRLPSVDVHTVGAGGGSIAWMDEGGALRVGPRSAGAAPGPACYGQGGPATVTDAHLVLGRLDRLSFLGGGLAVDPAAAVEALRPLGASVAGSAGGIVAVANASMQRALRVVSVERGYDPRDFTLVAFGGAGPMHACDLAEALSIRRVLIPRHPGLLSAMGMALADATRDISAPIMASPDGPEDEAVTAKVTAAFAALRKQLRAELGPGAEFEAAVDVRYEGQGYELTVSWPGSLTGALAAFQEAHLRRYGHCDGRRRVELTVARVRGRVRRKPPALPTTPEGGLDPMPALAGRRDVVFDTARETPVYEREKLLAGNRVEGPAVIAQMDSTTLIPPGWRAEVDSQGNVVIEGSPHA